MITARRPVKSRYMVAIVQCYTLILPRIEIYLVLIWQARVLCLWYKCYVPHCLCRLIAHSRWPITSHYKLQLGNWIYYIDSLDEFNYGPAHANSNHVIPMFVNKNRRILSMEIAESSYKWASRFSNRAVMC